jgi:hypothetical protein
MESALYIVAQPIKIDSEVPRGLCSVLLGALYTSANRDLNHVGLDWNQARHHFTLGRDLLAQYALRVGQPHYDSGLDDQLGRLIDRSSRSADIGPIESIIIRLQACVEYAL